MDTVRGADDVKQAARERMWALLEREGIALPPGAAGRIPHFAGADVAAGRLAGLAMWKRARVVKCNPDTAQLAVRVRAMRDGKMLYMAVPKLAEQEPFYLLDPERITQPFETVATGGGAARYASTVSVTDMPCIDLIVAGSVAVNRDGVRVGKGAGYSDIEVALLTEAGLVGPETVIVTTVHSLQVVDEELPETEQDFSVDLIVTPDEVIQCGPPRRPRGIVRAHLTPEKIAAIPVLGPYRDGEP